MTDKDRDAFEALMNSPYAVLSDHTPKAFCDGYQAALTHSAKALAEKDAEIEQLSTLLEIRKVNYDIDNKMGEEIERLQRVVDAANELKMTWTHCCEERPMVEINGVMFVAPRPMDAEISKAIGSVKVFTEALAAAEKEIV